MNHGEKLDPASRSVIDRVDVRQERALRSTLALLDAAAELVVDVGCERATLEAIAHRAGYSHGLVTRRFGTKMNLISALIDRATFSSPAAETTTSPEEIGHVLRPYDAVLSNWRHNSTSLRALYVIMLTGVSAQPPLKERIVQLNRDFREDVRHRVSESTRAGVIDHSVAGDEIATATLADLRGCGFLWVLDPEGFDFELAVRTERRHMAERLLGGGTFTPSQHHN